MCLSAATILQGCLDAGKRYKLRIISTGATCECAGTAKVTIRDGKVCTPQIGPQNKQVLTFPTWLHPIQLLIIDDIKEAPAPRPSKKAAKSREEILASQAIAKSKPAPTPAKATAETNVKPTLPGPDVALDDSK